MVSITKRNEFLVKLVREGVFKVIISNYNLARAYSKKARNSLKAAKILLEHDLFEESITLAYYSLFHQATAVLFSFGFVCKNHFGTSCFLKDCLGIDNSLLIQTKQERVEKQYGFDSDVVLEEVKELIAQIEKELVILKEFYERASVKDIENKRLVVKKLYF